MHAVPPALAEAVGRFHRSLAAVRRKHSQFIEERGAALQALSPPALAELNATLAAALASHIGWRAARASDRSDDAQAQAFNAAARWVRDHITLRDPRDAVALAIHLEGPDGAQTVMDRLGVPREETSQRREVVRG